MNSRFSLYYHEDKQPKEKESEIGKGKIFDSVKNGWMVELVGAKLIADIDGESFVGFDRQIPLRPD